MFSFKKTRAFYSFLLSYFIILLIPLVMGCIIYYKMLNIVESDEKESNMALLEKAKDTLDNGLIEIKRMVIMLGDDPYVKKFAIQNDPLKSFPQFYLYELVRRLGPYRERNRFIHSFYIYFRNSNRIIEDRISSSTPSNSFYENYFKYEGMDYDQWQELFLRRSHESNYFPTVSVQIASRSFNMLTYIQSFPAVYREDPTIIIWVLIDETVIQRILKNISNDGWTYIVDDNNQIMAFLSKSEDKLKVDNIHFTGNTGFIDRVINGQKMIVTYVSSSYTGWKYVSVVPYRTVMAKTRLIRFLMAGIGVAILFLGFLTAYMLALRSTKPIKEIVNVVRERLPSNINHYKNEYDFIKRNVREITEMNISLQKEMQQQLPMLRASFFERLFKGEYTTEDEIQSVLSRLGIDIRGSFFSVALLRINIYDNSIINGRLDNLFTAKAILKNIMNRSSRRGLHVHDRAEDKVVLLMCFKDSEFSDYRTITGKFLHEIFNIIYREHNIHLSFAAGKIYKRLRDVWHSYRESIEASESMRISSEFGIIWYEEHAESKGGYYYPLDLEERLMNNVKAANKEEVENILTLVYEENIENRRLSPDMLRLLTNDMCCSVIKLLNQIDLNENENRNAMIEKVRGLRHCESFNDAYKEIKSIYESIYDEIYVQKKSHKIELVNKIKEYIQQQHGDLSLNRYCVASHFGMSEEYFSSFFKEQAGVYFSDFLKEICMGKACELLYQKHLEIYKIARSVGYSNVKSFRRAFKKVNGISPSDYRKLILKDSS